MLDSRELAFEYREYTQEPLSVAEIGEVLSLLGVGPRDVLRRQDKAFRELGLGDQTLDDAGLIVLMSEHPTLLQRPIGVRGERAVVGRPAERLLELLE